MWSWEYALPPHGFLGGALQTGLDVIPAKAGIDTR